MPSINANQVAPEAHIPTGPAVPSEMPVATPAAAASVAEAVQPAPAAEPEVTQKQTRKEKLFAKLDVLAKRITADTENYNKIKAEYEIIDSLDNISVGTAVTIKQGRAETTREVTGIVIAIKPEDDGSAKYKVQYGEGFDADIAVVHSSGILAVVPSEL